jgi:membrane-anchored glycerophosphoryl diester phosphodiesterase (GDPDase)
MDTSLKVADLKASRGAAWLGEAFRFFRGAPLAWISMCTGWLAITFGLFYVPQIGLVIANFIQPVFFASFAIAGYKQAAGERLTMADLFSAFKRNLRALVTLGAVLLLAQIAIYFLMWLLGLPTAGAADRVITLEEYFELLQGKEWILLCGFVLTMMVKGALWFAPPLIAFHGMETMQAMRWSLYAAISNLGAMLVYGVALMALIFVVWVPLALGAYVAMLGLFVVIPMMAISTYIGYREVFEAQAVKPQ